MTLPPTTDNLAKAKQACDDRPHPRLQAAIVYALIDIAESLRKLSAVCTCATTGSRFCRIHGEAAGNA